MWELERRGFVKCGCFTPEVVLDYPERVNTLHEEYVLSGSDVVEAYTVCCFLDFSFKTLRDMKYKM